MNIIHFTHGKVNPFEESGMSRVVYYLNKYQKMKGHHSQIWSIVDNVHDHGTYKRDDFVTVELFPRLISVSRNRNALIRNVRKYGNDIDIGHFHMMWLIDKIPVAHELTRLGIPYVVTTHGSYAQAMMRIKYFKKIVAKYAYELRFLNYSSGVVAQTPEELTELRHFGVTAPIYLSSIGIEKEENSLLSYATPKRLIKSEEGIFRFGWIGNMTPIKNLHNLIKAFSCLPENLRKSCKVLLIGSTERDKRYVQYLRSLINDQRLNDQFVFIGPLYREEKYKVLQSVDAYIHVSASETISLAVLEAMICAKPLILSRTSQVSYLYNKNFFIMVEPSYDHIAQGIATLLSLPEEERKKMGDRAYEVVTNDFAWDKVAGEYLEIYKAVKRKHESG